MSRFLLMAGLVFPVISWLSLIAGIAISTREHHVSPVFIPLIGPLLLTAYICFEGHPTWTIAAVWLLDMGTLMFCLALPSLFADWWTYSSFTQLVSIEGQNGIERVCLTLHRSNHYRLQKDWDRGDVEILSLSETGQFSSDGEGVQLIAHFGMRRHLRQTAPTSFVVEEPADQTPGWQDNSLDGWSLVADCEFHV